MHRIGRQCISGCHRVGHIAGTYRHIVGQSKYGKKWRNVGTHLVFDQCDILHCFGRMDRYERRERHGNHPCADCDVEVHLELHRDWRYRLSIRDSDRVDRGSNRYPERESQHRFAGKCVDPDLDGEQRIHLHGVGRLEWHSGQQRQQVNRGT